MFLLLENTKTNGIFDQINTGFLFDSQSTNNIKMNHVKPMLCGHYIGIDRLERIKLLQGDLLVEAFGISVKEPECEIIFQMMILLYNLFLLFKFDFLGISEHRQQQKTFRLKYVFLAGKIISTARYVAAKLPEKYAFRDIYEKCMA